MARFIDYFSLLWGRIPEHEIVGRVVQNSYHIYRVEKALANISNVHAHPLPVAHGLLHE